MVTLRRRRYYVVYPEYFDANRSRGLGRRVPLAIADSEPTLKKLVKACELLKLEFIPEPDHAFPSNWWERNGRVLIKIDKNNKIPKEVLLKQISKIMRKLVRKKKTKVKKTSKAVKISQRRNRPAKAKK